MNNAIPVAENFKKKKSSGVVLSENHEPEKDDTSLKRTTDSNGYPGNVQWGELITEEPGRDGDRRDFLCNAGN